jgi:hypothetical protein
MEALRIAPGLDPHDGRHTFSRGGPRLRMEPGALLLGPGFLVQPKYQRPRRFAMVPVRATLLVIMLMAIRGTGIPSFFFPPYVRGPGAFWFVLQPIRAYD